MKVILYILGALLTLVGLVLILQGFNILLGSMMSGHIQYAILRTVGRSHWNRPNSLCQPPVKS